MSDEVNELKRLVHELDQIEFHSATDIHLYCDKVRKVSKALATSIEYAADELRYALEEVPPPPGEGQRAARVKARAVSRHLKRSASGVRQAGMSAVKTWWSLAKHYDHILAPAGKKKKPIDLTT